MDFPDTLNVFINSTENFVVAFEKKSQLKTCGFVRIFQADFDLHFSPSKFFSLLLKYNLIGVSYGHDFFLTDSKIQFNQAFHIP